MTIKQAKVTILDHVRAALKSHAQTVPEICACMNWQLPPEEVGRALRELVKSGAAEYVPIEDSGCKVPAWRKVRGK